MAAPMTVADLGAAQDDLSAVIALLVAFGQWSRAEVLEFVIGYLVAEHERETAASSPGGDAVAGPSLPPSSGLPTATAHINGDVVPLSLKPARHLHSIGSDR